MLKHTSAVQVKKKHQAAVLEIGMSHMGEIRYLASIAKPDVSVIINIGTMHIEHLGSMEGILQAKLEILEGMAQDGRIILNGDDNLLRNLSAEFVCDKVSDNLFAFQTCVSHLIGSVCHIVKKLFNFFINLFHLFGFLLQNRMRIFI